MRLVRLSRPLAALLVAALAGISACPHPLTPDSELAELVRRTSATAALAPGDVFEVRVYREPDLTGIFQVAPDGSIDYPLLGSLRVEGATSSQVATRIREGLAQGYIREPFVTVTVKEFQSRRVYILGQVEKAGTFRYEEGMSIIQLVTLAGGFNRAARRNDVVVTRTENGVETRIVVAVDDIAEGKARNFPLKPGDIVFVPESFL
jgi:polysaccharide export outer membrane protein